MRSYILLSTLPICFSSACFAQTDGLWDVVRRGQSRVIAEYLDSGGAPNARVSSPENEELQWPLLQVALFDREEEIALTLLRAGASFSALGIEIDLVIGEGLPAFLDELFLREPWLISEASRARQMALLYPSASKGYYQVVEVILSHAERLDLDWEEDIASEAVARALDARQDDIARILLMAGASPSNSVMHLAARASSPGMIRFLLSLGGSATTALSVEKVSPVTKLRTPMDFAWQRYISSSGDRREVARFVMFELMRAGATYGPDDLSVDVPQDGMAALNALDDPSEILVEAASMGYYESAAAALATASIEQDVLREALSASFQSLHNDISGLLIGAGAPLDGGTLHAAAASNSPGLVRLLLDLGANPNEVVDGQTPVQSWFERTQVRYLRASGEYILHELINGGGDACWLKEQETQLSAIAANFLRDTATECWP